MKIKAYAKVNLTLGITGKKDNMHLLDMLVGTIDLYDEVEVLFRSDGLINCTMDGNSQCDTNSAVKAASLVMAEYGFKGVDITIKKGIPFSAGLGGSTADGVAVVKAYERQYGIKVSNSLLMKIGSDAPCMYKGGLCLVSGLGDTVVAVNKNLDYNIAILIAVGGVNTKDAYNRYDEIPHKNKGINAAKQFLQTADLNFLANDLEASAILLNPNIVETFKQLKTLSPDATVMSGSGSAVVAYFKGDVPNNKIKNLIYTKFI